MPENQVLFGASVTTEKDAYGIGIGVTSTTGDWAWAYMDRDMARALAADLLAFADSEDTEEKK